MRPLNPSSNQPRVTFSNSPQICIRTGGKLFSDGTLLELLRDKQNGGLKLLRARGRSWKTGPSLRFREHTYKPPQFKSSSVLSAIRVPTEYGECPSTTELFAAVRSIFLERGYPEDTVFPLPYFVFATWFTDVLAAAPCLLIDGARPEANLFLQLFECMVRRPLMIGQLTSSGLCSLPVDLCPTLLIDQPAIAKSTLEMLRATSRHGFHVPLRGHLLDIFLSKVLYGGEDADGVQLGESTLRVSLPPLHGPFPVLTTEEREAIAGKFQPKFLAFRCQNILKVQHSSCDFPEFESSVRILSRILGAPVVDAPELQADLEPYLHRLQEELQGARAFVPKCVVIEALLHLCHEQVEKAQVRKISEVANAILVGRGEKGDLAPEQVGRILRKLGLPLNRSAKGSTLALNQAVHKKTHELAKQHSVAAVQVGLQKCPTCEGQFGPEGKT